MTLEMLQYVLTVITGEKIVYLCFKIKNMCKKCEKKKKKFVFHLLSAHIKPE